MQPGRVGAGRQDTAPPARRRRVPVGTMNTRSPEAPANPEPSKGRDGPNDRNEPMSDPVRIVPEPAPRDTARPDGLDGFRIEVDAARERVDIILDRPPLNIITMAQPAQLRGAVQ